MQPRTYLITGAGGMVGSALAGALRAAGTQVRALGRSAGLRWDPTRGSIDASAVHGTDVVVHLAGANIAGRRWSRSYKREIRDSRVLGTDLLARTIAAAEPRPRTLICASAIGYYGDRGEELLDEDAAAGDGFLAETCRAWEAAAEPARAAGVRVVHLRIGIVLSPAGGALARMLPAFRLGLAGRLGDGRQWVSWITLADLVRLIQHVAAEGAASGALLAVAPEPVTNAEFTKTLGRVLRRPTWLPVPAFALRLLLGEMAEALLLSSTRARSKRLGSLGFAFAHPTLEPALRALLHVNR